MGLERDTNTILFNRVIGLAQAHGDFERASQILDYHLAERHTVRELKDYEFRFVARVVWGGSEGVYIDCYLEGTFDQSGDKRLHVGTLKTLDASLEGFRVMGELAGALTYHARRYVDKNIDRYVPEKDKRSNERCDR
jgi:hypothetical protein